MKKRLGEEKTFSFKLKISAVSRCSIQSRMTIKRKAAWIGQREYFEVSLEEIENVVKPNNGEIEFRIEAKEYRESLVIRERLSSRNKNLMKEVKMEFPKELFT
jgi:hypothetical protein